MIVKIESSTRQYKTTRHPSHWQYSNSYISILVTKVGVI